jgi:hypothetical protein
MYLFICDLFDGGSNSSEHIASNNRSVTSYSYSRRGFGLDIVFIDHLQVVTTNNYNTIANLHILYKIKL